MRVEKEEGGTNLLNKISSKKLETLIKKINSMNN